MAILRSAAHDLRDGHTGNSQLRQRILKGGEPGLVEYHHHLAQALGKAVASERIAKKQYDQAAAKSADWESKAKAAIAAGDEELAKKALANKVKADKDTAQYKEMYDTISQQTETIRTQVEVLKSKLEEAKSRQAMLIARSQMADTQKA